MKKIRLFKPSVGVEELNNIKNVFKKSWLGYGPLVKNFEEKFAKFVGTKYAVGVNSGTAALHLSILSHNFKKGKISKCQICNSTNLKKIIEIGNQPLSNTLQNNEYDKP